MRTLEEILAEKRKQYELNHEKLFTVASALIYKKRSIEKEIERFEKEKSKYKDESIILKVNNIIEYSKKELEEVNNVYKKIIHIKTNTM